MLSSDYLLEKRKQKEQKQKQKKVRRNTIAVKLIMHKREEKKPHKNKEKSYQSNIYFQIFHCFSNRNSFSIFFLADGVTVATLERTKMENKFG